MFSFREALFKAQYEILKNDPHAFIFGLDVDDHKGIFGSTLGLQKDFPSQVFSTPLSEEGMTGVAIGAALNGMKPIHIHIRADFLVLALNQVLNMASNIRYVTQGNLSVPLVIRSVIGRGWGQGAQHSKTLHGTLSHFPGIKILVPATVQDAYDCLIGAQKSMDPVIVFEHRWLYDVQGELNTNKVDSPFKSHVVQAGNDISILATSWMVVEALHAAEFLKKQGISVEVINLRSIRPLDLNTILKSVQKTRRLVIADYDWNFAGISAEISAQIYDLCFQNLQAPIERVGFNDSPCPTARHLEDAFYPSAEHILKACFKSLEIKDLPLSGLQRNSWEDRFKGPF